MHKSFPFLLIITSILMAGGLWSYSQAVGSTIEVCVKRNGAVFVIGEGFRRADCRRNDTLMSWHVTGVPGPKGDKGDKGDKGNSGSSLHLFDGSGQDLGIFLGTDRGGPETFILGPNVKANFVNTNPPRLVASVPNIFFESGDCSNDAFLIPLPDVPSDAQTLVATREPRYFKVASFATEQININSYLNPGVDVLCRSLQEATTTRARLEEVILPFTLPLAWPLEIREN